jgi:hypothetical protein
MKKLIIKILDDGTIKTDARNMSGSEKDILKVLNDLASTVGGELEVEKHIHGAHTHTHDDDHDHDHN